MPVPLARTCWRLRDICAVLVMLMLGSACVRVIIQVAKILVLVVYIVSFIRSKCYLHHRPLPANVLPLTRNT
jgi:hypothetical protein